MADGIYTARSAAADLHRAGLLAGVLGGRSGGLQTVAPDQADGGFSGAGLDSRRLRDGQLFVALRGERADGRDHAPAVVAAGHWVLTGTVDRGDPLPGTAAAEGAGVLLSPRPEAALAELARCWRGRHDADVAAVTGTNGKTTTKDLLAALLGGAGPVHATTGNLNNHLGVPLTLLGLRPEHRFAVIEMGASAVGDIAALARLAAPRVGIITNAAPAHLAEFGSLDGIVEGKGELAAALPADGVAVLNADSPGFARWQARCRARVVSFGDAGAHPWRWQADAAGGGRLELDGAVWPVPLPGAHNGANLAAAILAARALGLDDAAMGRGLAAFAGSPHRGVVLELGGRTLLDDAYNANPRSMVAAAVALAGLPGPGNTVAVLGAMAELGPDSTAIHETTGRELAQVGLDRLLAVGPAAAGLAAGFDAAGGSAHRCGSCAEAAAWLAAHTASGDRILIKGSRSAAMERVLAHLETHWKKD